MEEAPLGHLPPLRAEKYQRGLDDARAVRRRLPVCPECPGATPSTRLGLLQAELWEKSPRWKFHRHLGRGPPTLEQHPEIARQRSEDPEFWMFFQRALEDIPFSAFLDHPADELAPDASGPQGELGPVRWLTERLGRQQLASYLQIVRILDDVLNNTSVILLIEAGGKRLLFPGDAQIENWEYPLKVAPNSAEICDLLRGVDLYKVGHHGSRNATPRTLFGLWTEDATRNKPMTALMSTLSGVHGESEATRVPRATLVGALEQRMALHSTEDIQDPQAFAEIVADRATESGFQPVS